MLPERSAGSHFGKEFGLKWKSSSKLELYPRQYEGGRPSRPCSCRRWSRPEVTTPCGLLGENEKFDARRCRPQRDARHGQAAPAVARARTMADRLRMDDTSVDASGGESLMPGEAGSTPKVRAPLATAGTGAASQLLEASRELGLDRCVGGVVVATVEARTGRCSGRRAPSRPFRARRTCSAAVRIAAKLGCSISSSRPCSMPGCCATGINERPSMTRPGLAFATSTIVGARSALIARSPTFTPLRDARPAHQPAAPGSTPRRCASCRWGSGARRGRSRCRR